MFVPSLSYTIETFNINQNCSPLRLMLYIICSNVNHAVSSPDNSEHEI